MLRARNSKKSGLGLFVIGGLVLAALFAAAFYFKAPKLDEIFCPETGALYKTIIILDTSDPLTQTQQAAFYSFLNSLVTPPDPASQRWSPFVKKGALLAAYEIADSSGKPKERFRMCSPGDPNNRSWKDRLTKGLTLAKIQWLEFEERLQSAFPESITGKELPTSPIIETLDYVKKREFGDTTHLRSSDNSVGTIVVISDMLQNMPKCSHYKSCRNVMKKSDNKEAPKEGAKSDYFKCEQSNACGSPENAYDLYGGVDFTGVNIVIKYLQVDRYRKLQGAEHFTWWRKFFAIAGAPSSVPPDSW